MNDDTRQYILLSGIGEDVNRLTNDVDRCREPAVATAQAQLGLSTGCAWSTYPAATSSRNRSRCGFGSRAADSNTASSAGRTCPRSGMRYRWMRPAYRSMTVEHRRRGTSVPNHRPCCCWDVSPPGRGFVDDDVADYH